MNEQSKAKIFFPPWMSIGPIDHNIVIIGANGSGKTRLGIWLEDGNEATQRISAQRSLSFNIDVPLQRKEHAEPNLWYGHPRQNRAHRRASRWHGQPANYVLNDFDALLSTLFARQRERNQRHSDHVEDMAKNTDTPILPGSLHRNPSELDKIKRIWSDLFPHRTLIIGHDSIMASRSGESEGYSGLQMSDGERVSFYLAGQALCAPERAVIIFDEPEIHLHKSICQKFFDYLEFLRPDCLFAYITHDVDFAATRKNATKLWIKDWDGNDNWELELIKTETEIPEPLLLCLLGNRKPVLFVEGEINSLDARLFSSLFQEHLIVPCGSCEKVIESVRAYKKTSQLSHIASHGIVDLDRRNDHEVETLLGHSIYTLTVSEVENLFLAQEVIFFIAQHLHQDQEKIFQDVKKVIYDALVIELDVQASEMTYSELKRHLESIELQRNKSDLIATYNSLKEGFDIEASFNHHRRLLQEAIESDNYSGVLRLYNRKSLTRQVCRAFALDSKKDAYTELVLGILASNDENSQKLRAEIVKQLPTRMLEALLPTEELQTAL